uniref:Uncharacterized protein n=1 Tax=Megaselia scalaris TaxID=36166 RepID=T1GMN9_MEGSC
MKTMHQEREALKKLSNVKKDHAKRLDELTKNQEVDKQKAELITRNQELVDNAILAVRSALANQMSWPDIKHLVKSAQNKGDPVADSIKQLKFEINNISLFLKDPYRIDDSDDEDEEVELPSMTVDIDLDLSAWANARKYYDLKRVNLCLFSTWTKEVDNEQIPAVKNPNVLGDAFVNLQAFAKHLANVCNSLPLRLILFLEIS